jgi:hypothetical protein
MRLNLVLTLAIACGFATVALADDDFPPYSQPTNFDQSPIEQMRSGAADQLQSRGFKISADQVRTKRFPLPFFGDILGTTDYATFNQQVIFLGPSGVPLLLNK